MCQEKSRIPPQVVYLFQVQAKRLEANDGRDKLALVALDALDRNDALGELIGLLGLGGLGLGRLLLGVFSSALLSLDRQGRRGSLECLCDCV